MIAKYIYNDLYYLYIYHILIDRDQDHFVIRARKILFLTFGVFNMLVGQFLSKKDIDAMDMEAGEKKMAHMVLDAGGDIIFLGETETGYDISYVFGPITTRRLLLRSLPPAI